MSLKPNQTTKNYFNIHNFVILDGTNIFKIYTINMFLIITNNTWKNSDYEF